MAYLHIYLKKKWPAVYAGPVYWIHSDFADIGEKPLV